MTIVFSGCLLPLLIILNLFFGRLFFTTTQWLAVAGILLLLLLLNSYISVRRAFSALRRKDRDAIDVEGKVMK